jgi:hypothetical protein
MNTQDYILIQQFCSHYNVPVSFIDALKEFELIDIIPINNELYIDKTLIKDVEKLIRLHYDLDINLEGIHAITNLLKHVEDLQNEIVGLNNRLNFYEDF